MQVRILGPLLVEAGGRAVHLPGQQRRVLAALALRAGRAVTIGALADAVWDGGAPALARRQVQNHVSALRGVLARLGSSSVIGADNDAYTLRIGPAELDRAVFDDLVAQGRQAAAGGDVRRAADRLRAALDLWRGPALEGLDTPVLARAAAALDAERDLVTEEWLELQVQAGRHREVLGELTRLVAERPLREGPVRLLMVALSRLDRRADALAHYEGLAARLRAALGVEPGPALQATNAAMRGEPGEAGGRTPPSQLPGAVRLFVGRDRELDALDAAVGATGLAVLTGPGGVGKTGLALAWAHRNAAGYPDGRLYVDLHGFDHAPPRTPADALTGFLHALGVEDEPGIEPEADEPAVPEGYHDPGVAPGYTNKAVLIATFGVREPRPGAGDAVAGLAAAYRSALAGRRVLVVLDNAADANQVEPLLPGAPGCAVVVTTRCPLPELTAARDAVPIELGPLAPAAARELLGGMLRDPIDPGDEPLAETVAELCGHLPRALRVVGANLRDAGPAALREQIARLRADRSCVLAPETFHRRTPDEVALARIRSSGEAQLPPLYYLERTGPEPRLVVWSTHRAEPAVLATLPPAAFDNANVSPDARWLSWVDEGALYVRDLTGVQPPRILHGDVDGRLFPPVWTRDSRRVLVRTGGGAAGTVDAGSGRFAALAADLAGAAHPMFSVCGRVLAYLDAAGTLTLAEPDGRDPRPAELPRRLADDGRRVLGVQSFAPGDLALSTGPADTPIGARSLLSDAYVGGEPLRVLGLAGSTGSYTPYQLRLVPPAGRYGYHRVQRECRGRRELVLLGGNGEYRGSAVEPPILDDFLLLSV
ncbi:BTAD domain-containing putative transcriptional regulator [Dactylosporangium sp. NPDC049140]|uniref:AfsR/SARP family transcriptional regulator n=1 Tax=Dactylosporangium sp. NPDC049140 TaxID=3155647 RepID=UPI0033E7E6AD